MIEFTLEELKILNIGMSVYEKSVYNFRYDKPYDTPITPILRKIAIMMDDATPDNPTSGEPMMLRNKK